MATALEQVNQAFVPTTDAQRQALAGVNQAFAVAKPPTIFADSLTEEAKPLTVPPVPTPTTADGINAYSQFISDTVKERDAKAAEGDTQKSSLLDLMNQTLGVQGQRAELEQQLGTQKLSETARKAANDLTVSQRAQQNELRVLNEKALSAPEKAVAVGEITRRYAFEQADLQLSYHLANSDYLAAESAIDKKIQLQLEPLKAQLEFTKLFYDEARADLSKTDQRAFEAKLAELNNNLETQKNNAEEIKKLQLTAAQNGAPTNVVANIGKAKDYNSAILAMGQYGISDIQRQQLTNLKLTGQKLGGKIGVEGLSSIAQAVADNPNLINSLTPTVKGQVITQLSEAGYDISKLGGRPLSDTAISKITDTEKAIADLEGLKLSIDNSKDYVGPISGFAALNPWSPAKQVQADIDRVRQTVGKALEGGVLRKEDEEKYKKILPTVNDTYNTVVYKMQQLDATMRADIERYRAEQALQGRGGDITVPLEKKGTALNGETSGGNTYIVTKE